jgi:hypothetical protein
VAEVKSNFERYDLRSPQVRLLEGLFGDTLPAYPYGAIAVLRMDGDLYSSTTGRRRCDYGVVIDAKRAVLAFRVRRGITEPLVKVDGDAVYWRKS